MYKRRSGTRPLRARWYGVLSRRAERGELGKRRRALLAQASGRVLDLGVGTGESFQHFPPAVSDVVALDPDPVMLRQARRRVVDAAMPVRLLRGVGERLPCADETFDTAVAALVLCTVEDLEATVAEIHRVLRPGGRLLLMEHVRATDEVLADWQDRFERPWSWFNGCRPNRRTVEAIQAAGFRTEGLERYGYSALPHVQGVAVRQ
jgi:ubiquinone/menaquinone biosynthesis C-methylase UbiE